MNSECDDCDSNLNDTLNSSDGKKPRASFLQSLFGEHEATITKEDFCAQLMKPSCKWIFNDEQIRSRLRELIASMKKR